MEGLRSGVVAHPVSNEMPISVMGHPATTQEKKKRVITPSGNVKIAHKLTSEQETIVAGRTNVRELTSESTLEFQKNKLDQYFATIYDGTNGERKLVNLKNALDEIERDHADKQQTAIDDETDLYKEIKIQDYQQKFLSKVRRCDNMGQLEQMLSFSYLLSRTISNMMEFKKVDIETYQATSEDIATFLYEQQQQKRKYARAADAPESQLDF